MTNFNWNYLIIGIVVIVILILLYKYIFSSNKKQINKNKTHLIDNFEYQQSSNNNESGVNSSSDGNFVTIQLPTEPQYIGTEIIVKTPKNTYFKVYDDMKNNYIYVDLQDENMIEHIIIRAKNGDDMIFNYPEINKTIKIENKLEQLEREIFELQSRINSYDDN